MKTITQDFKNNVCLLGRELDSKITYEFNGEDVELGSEELNSITPHYESSILKSVMKQLDIDSNVEIPVETEINYQFGIKTHESYSGTFEIVGQTSQSEIPTPSNPVDIITKTGNITEIINDEEYNFTLGNIELCKIGDYEDKIYKNNGVWYLHKEIGKQIFDGSDDEAWGYVSSNQILWLSFTGYKTDGLVCLSNYYIGQENVASTGAVQNNHVTFRNDNVESNQSIYFKNTSITSAANFKTWLSTHNTEVYYVLATPTDTEITDSTLLNQLNNVGVPYEYINYGNFIVYKSEKQEDTNSWKITCYDKMLYAMQEYQNMNLEYPMTIRSYINAICNYLGLVFKNINDEFPNYDKEIQKELYIGEDGASLDYTFRDVFDELAQVTAGTICINENDDELEIRYITDTNDTIDEEYLKDINVNFGEIYGPINSIVLSRAGGSDNIYKSDSESVDENGLCEVKISDNQIMNWNDRADYLPDILDKLNGLQYYLNDFSSTGICYYEVCDRYNIQIGENIYSCIMFNDEINITQGLEENVYTDMPEEAKTDYTKADKTDRRINQAYIIVDKQNGTITSLIDQTTNLDKPDSLASQLSRTEQTVESIQSMFQITGGSNLIKNSQFLLTDEVWEIDDENGYVTSLGEGYNSELIGETTSIGNIIMKNATINTTENNIIDLKIDQQYSLHFYYSLDEETTGKIKLTNSTGDIVIFEETYTEEAEMEEVSFSFIANLSNYKLTFETTTTTSEEDIGFFKIYDLMLNSGDIKPWEPANSEIYSTVLKMSQLGLQVYASGSETLTLMTSMGFKIYQSNDGEIGEIITDFTNTGIDTLNIKASQSISNGIWKEKNIEINGDMNHVEYIEEE